MFASSVDLNKFLATLDVRYEKKVAKAGGTVAKKRRVVGHPSDTSIPPGAPRWMINQGMQVFRLTGIRIAKPLSDHHQSRASSI